MVAMRLPKEHTALGREHMFIRRIRLRARLRITLGGRVRSMASIRLRRVAILRWKTPGLRRVPFGQRSRLVLIRLAESVGAI